MFNLKKIAEATYLMEREAKMRVPGLIVATDAIMQEVDFEKPLEQVRNVAYLPGIVGHSIAMPDIHWGYGFPIGGVAAMDPETGVISPGGVGYDINCGVRLAIIPETIKSIEGPNEDKLLIQSAKNWKGRDIFEFMEKQGVSVMATSGKTVAEEMPDAYKDVDKVVDAVEAAKLAGKVARLKPRLCLKG